MFKVLITDKPKKRRKISIKMTNVDLEGYLTEEYSDEYEDDLLVNDFITIETKSGSKTYLTTIRTQCIEYITEEKEGVE